MRISDWSSDVCSSDLQVEQIVWAFKLAPETLHLPERPGVPEVQVFSIQLKVPELHRDVLRSIDGAIPIDAKDCPSAHSLGLEWIERFIVQASTEQLTAFELVADAARSEEHTSELQSLMRIAYDVFCLKKKHNKQQIK